MTNLTAAEATSRNRTLSAVRLGVLSTRLDQVVTAQRNLTQAKATGANARTIAAAERALAIAGAEYRRARGA